MIKTLAVTALILGMAGSAFATDTGTNSGTGSGNAAGTENSSGAGRADGAAGSPNATGDDHAKTWAPNVNDTFFTDSTGSTLRDPSDVKMRWSKLSPEEQDKVRADCKDMKSDSMGGMGEACKWVNAM